MRFRLTCIALLGKVAVVGVGGVIKDVVGVGALVDVAVVGNEVVGTPVCCVTRIRNTRKMLPSPHFKSCVWTSPCPCLKGGIQFLY